MRIYLPNKYGFTLIEILIAISIIGILTAITASSLNAISQGARNTQRNADLRQIQNALEQFHADKGYYPSRWLLSANKVGSLTNCTDAPPLPVCVVNRTYLNLIPHDPRDQYDPTSGLPVSVPEHYCYGPSISRTNNTVCDPATPATCQYYGLYAQIEDNSVTTTYACHDGTGASITRNLLVTP